MLFFLVGVAILGLLALLFLKHVLHFRTWFIALLFIGLGLVLHFATLRMFM